MAVVVTSRGRSEAELTRGCHGGCRRLPRPASSSLGDGPEVTCEHPGRKAIEEGGITEDHRRQGIVERTRA